MNIYNLIRLYRKINNPRIKLLGLLTMHILRRRYLYIVMDPSLTCNLRCRMCYFSDPEKRKTLHGTFNDEDIKAIADAVFHRGLKLQIGCGAEPTTYKKLADIVRIAKQKGIPNISITTNGNLLTHEWLQELVDNGLTEIILSLHGLQQEIYENMMRGASFDKFKKLLKYIYAIKQENPNFNVRINYTVNKDNIDDLKLAPEIFNELKPDVLQLRPVQDIGSPDYENYSMDEIISKYDECIKPLLQFCENNGITCLYPEHDNLMELEKEDNKRLHLNNIADMLPYFHLSPYSGWKDEFNPYIDTFETYCRRTRRVRYILHELFGLSNKKDTRNDITKALNYQIK